MGVADKIKQLKKRGRPKTKKQYVRNVGCGCDNRYNSIVAENS